MKHPTKKFLFALTFIFFFSNQTASAQDTLFEDVPIDHPHAQAINALGEKGVFNGYPDGSFGLHEMNRAEVMTVTLRALEIEPDPTIYKDCFLDVQEQWFAPYICYGKEQGWIKGYHDGSFRPSHVDSSEIYTVKMILNAFFYEEISQIDTQKAMDYLEISEKMSDHFFQNYHSDELKRVFTFAIQEELLIDNGWHTYAGDFSPPYRQKVAEYIYRSLLLKEEGQQVYQNYMNEYWWYAGNCQKSRFETVERNGLDFLNGYPVNELGYKSVLEIESTIYTCKLEDGYLVSTFITEDGRGDIFGGERQLARYDEVGNLQDYQSLWCEYDTDKLLALPFPLGEPDYTLLSHRQLPSYRLADLETLEFIDCYFAKDMYNIYTDYAQVEGADLETFEPLELRYGRDSENVYYADVEPLHHNDSMVLTNADPNSFYLINDRESKNYRKHPFTADENNVYFGGLLLENADPKSFEIINRYYSRDNENIYYDGKRIEDVHVNSFEAFNQRFSKDKNHVYLYGEIDEKLDAESFVFINNNFYKDKNHVYHYQIFGGETIVENADSETFEVLDTPIQEGQWAKTDTAIFKNNNQMVEVTDPASFEVLSKNYQKDKDNIYVIIWEDGGLRGEFMIFNDVDVESFEILPDQGGLINGHELARDMNNLFFEHYRLDTEDLDIQTVELVEGTVVKDANDYYCWIDTNSPEKTTCGTVN